MLNFSDPLRDPSFCSKAIIAGTLMVVTGIKMGLGVSDSWLYFEQWEYKGHQIILQVCLLYVRSCLAMQSCHCCIMQPSIKDDCVVSSTKRWCRISVGKL